MNNHLPPAANGQQKRPGPPPSAAPKGNPLRPMRKPRPAGSANPLLARRRVHPDLASKQAARPGGSHPSSAATGSQPHQKSIQELRRQHGGWTGPPPPGSVDYPLIITKRDLKAGRRFHVMRFDAVANKNEKTAADGTRSVDPSDSEQFTPPVTLHRRDPRQPPIGRQVKEENASAASAEKPAAGPVSEDEAARIAQAKADREAQRALDMAQIAPVAKDPNASAKKSKKNTKVEKVTAVFQRPDESFKKESELHYEESLPWHLEDADGKNVWVGSYVGPLSETNAALVIEGSSFRMIPLEKYYKFKAKPSFTPYTIDEAENIMNKKAEVGRWTMVEDEKMAHKKEMEESRRMLYGPSKIKTESSSFKNSSRAEKMDHDELDISDEEFPDDDEQPALERDNDEDMREAEAKIRRDQLGANLFGHADEEEVDRQVKEEELEEEDRKVLGKAVRKMLLKREKEAVYATDSDDDPFKSSSDEDEEEVEEAGPNEAGVKAAAAKVGGQSGKGSTTPSGKPKQSDNLKKGKSLKRPGSPNLSDASSNESSRKKVKKTVSSVKASRATTPMPSGSNLRAASSASDGDATAGEMSDSAPSKKKTKLVAGGTPAASRAGSPNPPPGPEPTLLTPAELLAGLPALPGAIGIMDLIKKYPGRVGDGPGKVAKPIFIKMVREVAVIGTDKLLRRKS